MDHTGRNGWFAPRSASCHTPLTFWRSADTVVCEVMCVGKHQPREIVYVISCTLLRQSPRFPKTQVISLRHRSRVSEFSISSRSKPCHPSINKLLLISLVYGV